MDAQLGAVLLFLQRHWQAQAENRPWGMWITRHAPVDGEADALDYAASPALDAWFLSDSGVTPRSPWGFRRFWSVHFLQPWCQRPYSEQTGIYGERRYPIGIASFAPYAAETNWLYVQLTYGRLFGRGYRLRVSDGVVDSEVELWRS
ncbi:MAG: hypothetical protein ACK47B_20765 [Armatimonadota bacterium]